MKYITLFLLGTIISFSSGCATREAYMADVMASRSRAAQETVERIQLRGREKVVIEGELNLPDAIRLALAHNKGLLKVVEQREVARGRLLQSYAVALPSVSVDSGYVKLDESKEFDVAGREVSMGVEDNYSAALSVRQPLFHGGAIPARLNTARLFTLLSNEHVRSAVQSTIFHVCETYFDVLLANHLLEVNRDAVKSAEAYLMEVQKKQRHGVASEYDVLRAQVEVSNFRAELIHQQNVLNLSETKLLKVLGVSQESKFILTDELDYRPVRPLFTEAIDIAQKTRSDLQQAELNIRMHKQALRLARSKYWPQVDIFFSQEWGKPDPHSATTDDWGDAWRAGASLALPLFDGFSRYGKVVEKAALLKQAELNLADAEEQTLLEVRQAILSIRDAEELVESQKMNLKRAKEGLRLVQAGYREGITREVEVMDARTALTRTEALYYDALYAHTIARLYLQRALGILGPDVGEYRVPSDTADPRDAPLFDNDEKED